ncbi:hypothetical protein F4803DRAFT_574297 [Xylaria telfairii]|nr:hypothetical protein F4803DRAFT_574297 [Xylaria telfairii]
MAHMLLCKVCHTREYARYAIWRTLSANTGWWEQGDLGDDKTAYDAYIRFAPDIVQERRLPDFSMEVLEQIWPPSSAIMKNIQGYCFGITTCGHMGLLPNEMRAYDLLVVVGGSRTPLILKLQRDGKSYELVTTMFMGLWMGSCFVDVVIRARWRRRIARGGRIG